MNASFPTTFSKLLPNKVFYFHLLGVCLLGGWPMATFAQSDQRPNAVQQDIESWNGVKLSHEFSKAWDGYVEEQVRFNRNLTAYKSSFSEAGASFRLHKMIELGASYRLTARTRTVDHRISLDAQFRYREKPFTFYYRHRLQRDWKANELPTLYSRQKARVRYDINKKLEFDVGGELFYDFSYNSRQFDQLRLSAGLEYELNKRQSIDLGYSYQRELFVRAPTLAHVISLSYAYKLKW